MKGSVVVSGAVARRCGHGGHVWALLQWVLGFRELGWKVLFLDRLDESPGVRCSGLVRRFVDVLRGFGLEDDFSLDLGSGREAIGLSRDVVRERVEGADLLLNIMGYLEDEELLGRSRFRVFLDIDPGFGQMWHALGLSDVFRGHDAYVTVGTNLGGPRCTIPTCDLAWMSTLPPVVLSHWPPAGDPGRHFTTVGSWRGPYDPVEFQGTRYGLRVHEFRTYAEIPVLTGLPFEVALEIDDADRVDSDRLRDGGWRLMPPEMVAGTPGDYRRYVQGSRAEFMVAKEMYVRSRSGWFSDRTACYLASGRPAIVQDTGLEGVLETGEGLLTFGSVEEAVEGVRSVDADWDRHSRAARELAEARLDSDRVIRRLVEGILP